MKRVDLADLVVIIGLAMMAAGLAAFDWRLAAVVIGLMLLVIGLVGAARRG